MTHGTASLVVGADGQIGQALYRKLAAAGAEVVATSRRRPTPPRHIDLDLAAGPESWPLPNSVSTAYLCAAVTSLEACRQDPSGSFEVNVRRTVDLARRLIARGAFVLFPSTNLVFDGSAALRRAAEPTCPRTEYGRQKADAERQLLSLGEQVAIVRLTKVIAPHMPLLVEWRSALQNGETIHPFSDMVMSPLPLKFVVDAMVQIAALRRPGIFHVSADAEITYAEAAQYLARRLQASPQLVQPARATETGNVFEAPPAHTTLETSRLQSELGLKPPDVWQALDYGAGLS